MPMPGFFGTVIPNKARGAFAANTAIKPALLDVGDVKDSGFKAAAAAIISNVLTKPRVNNDLLIQLLEQHSKYVEMPVAIGHLTPAQRFEKMLAKPDHLAQFTRDLAYTLRQLAVNEMCQFPKKYHLAFIGENAPKSIADMREPNALIHLVSMEALANVLKIPIRVNEIKPEKELQKQHHFGPDKQHARCDEIVLQKQRNHYIPQIIQVERFKLANAHATRAVRLLPNPPQITVTLATIQEDLKQESLELTRVFEHHVRRLMAMVDAGEVTKKSLLSAFVQGLAKEDSFDNIKKAGLALGSQRYFEYVINGSKHAGDISNVNQSNGYDEQIIKALVDAFARDITIGQRDENSLFAQLESLENSHKRSKNMSF